MEFQDVLANNESMAGKWQEGNPPQGDFRAAMLAVQKVLPPGSEKSLSNNTYSQVFWGLSQLYYKQWLTQTFKTADGMFVSVNSCPLKLTATRTYELGGWVEQIGSEWQGYGFGSEAGFAIYNGDLSQSDFVALKDLPKIPGQSEGMQKVSQALGSLKLPRYSKTGLLHLLIDMLWWGYSCFQSNGDTIGEGDQEFFAYYSVSSVKSYLYFLEHPEEEPYFKTKLVFDFYPRQAIALDIESSPQAEPDDTDTLDFPFIIDLEFIGYSKDLIGSTDYNPNRINDAFILATVSSKTNQAQRHTLTDVGLESDELLEDKIWATTVEQLEDSPLGVCTVVQDSSGHYLPGKLLNPKDNAIAISLKPGAVFGLVLDLGSLTPKTPTLATHATSFNCYFKFEDMSDEQAIEAQVVIPLV